MGKIGDGIKTEIGSKIGKVLWTIGILILLGIIGSFMQ